MTMGEVTASQPAFDMDDLIFMDEERSLKDLTMPSTSSSGENSRLNSSDSSDTFTGCYLSAKRPRIEETPSPSGFDYLFDGLDLPTSVMEVATPCAEEDIEKTDDEEDDCHDYYGKIEWCDAILEKFEAQLAKEKDEEQDASISEAMKLVEEHDQEQERERIMKKTARAQKNNKMKMLSQASKETSLFCCFICHKGFVSEDHVQQHVNNVHLREDKRYPYKCDKCHMRFAHVSNLSRHQATHAGVTFKCRQCPYEFKTQSTLDIHIAREHAKKETDEVSCEICRKEFNSDAELKRHSWYCMNKEDIALKRKQTKVAKLGVNTVSPALSTASMSSGTSTGSGGRPIKDKTCPYCLDPFASMQSRNRHIASKHPEKKNDVETTTVQYFKVDSPDLPYACLICSKRFATSSSLNTHKKRIHEKKLDHVCGKCGKAYPLGSELRKHLRRVHNVTEVDAQDMTSF